MIERLIRWGVPRYLGGPGRSWVFSSFAIMGYRLMRSRSGKRELIDIGSVGKGQKIVIEHVSDSHAKQLKAEKRAKKVAKAEKKTVKKALRAERRTVKTERRATKADQRADKAARRQVRKATKAESKAIAST